MRRWRAGRVGEAGAATAILLVAAALRLFRIAALPPGFFQDEAVYAVNAQTILDGVARIYYGEREPLYEYLAALGMSALGRSPLATHVTSALIGLIGVAAAGALAYQLFGRRVGLIAAAGMATSLWLTTIGRIGFRAITLPTVECLGLALLWRATRTNRRRDYLVAGVVLGLTLYTYLAARFLPIALLGFGAVCVLFHRAWLRERLAGFGVAFVAAVVTCLPLGWYALRHPEMIYGRPDQVALPGGSAFWPAFADAARNTLGMIAIQGDTNWRQNLSGAPVFDPLNAALFLVGLAVAVRWRKPEAWLALVVGAVMLGPSMLSIDSPHYLRTLGAAGPIYALWALGVDRVASAVGRLDPVRASDPLSPRERVRVRAFLGVGGPHPNPLPRREGIRRALPGSEGIRDALPLAEGIRSYLSVAVICLAVGVAFGRTAYDYFVVYPSRPELRGAFATDLVAVGQTLAASPIWRNDRANVYLPLTYDDNRGSIAYFLYPLMSPTERAAWMDEGTIGTFVDFTKTVPLPDRPSVYVVPLDDTTTLPILGAAAQQTVPIVDRFGLAAREVLAAPAPASDRSDAPLVRFGSLLELETARVDPTGAELRWKVLAQPSYQPSVFVYVQDAQRHQVAQADEEIAYQASRWRPDQELVTRHLLRLPPGTPPGTYDLVVGVYDKASGRREAPTRSGQPLVTVEAGQLHLAAPIPGTPSVDHRTDRLVAPGLRLLGFDSPPASVEAGTPLPLSLVWQASDSARPDEDVGLIARRADGAIVSQWWGQPAGSGFSTSQWSAATAIRQIQDLPIPATAVGPIVVSVTARPLGVPGNASASSPPVELGRVTVKAATHAFAAPAPRESMAASFADVGTLVGVDLPTRPISPGGNLDLTLYWQASGAAPAPDTVFVHVLDAQNHVLAQRDEPPVHGTRPTTGWVAGEYVADPHQLTIDPHAPPGAYQVEVGLYDPATGARVNTGTPDNRIVVGTITISG